MAEELTTMFYQKPVYEWAEALDTAEVPHDYYLTFAAIFATTLSLILPFKMTDYIVDFLASRFIPDHSYIFISQKYLPTLGQAVASVNLSLADKLDVARKFTGMLIKMLYAFVWQEHVMPQFSFLYNSVGLHLGAALMLPLNDFASKLSGFPQTDQYVTSGLNLYPGQAQCKIRSPHALWHE